MQQVALSAHRRATIPKAARTILIETWCDISDATVTAYSGNIVSFSGPVEAGSKIIRYG